MNHPLIHRILALTVTAASITGAFFAFTTQHTVPPASSTPHLDAVSRRIIDLPYCEGETLQHYDLYLPPFEVSGPYPVVMYVHGGGWSLGDKQSNFTDYYGSALVEAGFAFASINYRLAPKHRYPTQDNDIACAIRTIVKRADDYQVDTKKIVLFGESAGGLLVANYALSPDHPEIPVKAVVDFYGTTDLVYQLNRKKYANHNAINYLGKNDMRLARSASPLYRPLYGTPPPFLFVHGTNDTMVSIEQARALYERLKPLQPQSKFITVTHAGHGFSAKSSPSNTAIRDEMIRYLVGILYGEEALPILDAPAFLLPEFATLTEPSSEPWLTQVAR
ncbi:MAG: alpha/beta hydrolase [Candidatus Saccharimonas sp.]